MTTTLTVLKHAGKILVGGLVFYLGLICGAMAAATLGVPAPSLPEGVDMATLGPLMLLSSLLVPAVLAPLSRGLAVGAAARWLILAALAWVALGINTALEAAVFSPGQASLVFSGITYLSASLACAAVVAWLYPFGGRPAPFERLLSSFLADRSAGAWAWRALLAIAAFPVIYTVFGLAVRPMIEPYYVTSLMLRVPDWGELLPVLLLRSLLFLLVLVPVMVAWHGSRRKLLLTVGAAVFMLVGGIYMLQSYWLPVSMRIIHAAEILADSYAHVGVLILLLHRRPSEPVLRPDPTRTAGPAA